MEKEVLQFQSFRNSMKAEQTNTPPVRGPLVLLQTVVDARAKCEQILRTVTDPEIRDYLNKKIASLDLALNHLQSRRVTPPGYYREIDDLTERERVMARLAKKICRGRDVIYHGTRNLPEVLRAGKFVPPPTGERGVFFTRSAEVAAYFGCLPGDESQQRSPGILVLDRSSLRQCYRIVPTRYDVFSPRDEREEAIWCRTVNFRRHLLGVVGEADVNAILGPNKHRYLPRNFVHWPAARRRQFTERQIAAGHRFVRKGRERVREFIVRGRKAAAASRTSSSTVPIPTALAPVEADDCMSSYSENVLPFNEFAVEWADTTHGEKRGR
jgi:hypothetical protein